MSHEGALAPEWDTHPDSTRSTHRVVVVGSANVDSVFGVSRIPKPGETVLAQTAATYPGGKGLNQSVAAARAGAATTLIAGLGRDVAGENLVSTMESNGISTHLLRSSDLPTGQAFIVVDQHAENTIIVSAGANNEITALTEPDLAEIAASSVVLMQMEIPLELVRDAASAGCAAGTTVILNAAPARTLPTDILDNIDYLIVNEHEACLVGGSSDLHTASLALASQIPWVIVTLGPDGAVLYEAGQEAGRVEPPAVVAVDTTGAGDTFCGAFAAAIAEGQDLLKAAEFATRAASLSVQSLGAVPSIPFRARIDAELGVRR
jgi:ribokinase